MNTDPLAKPSVVDFSRAFTPKLLQKLLKQSTSCFCADELSPIIRMIHQPEALEIILGEEEATDTINCKSNQEKNHFKCTGSGTFSNYSVDIGLEYCQERLISDTEEDVEEISFCSSKGFILLDALLHTSTESPPLSPEPNKEETSGKTDPEPKPSASSEENGTRRIKVGLGFSTVTVLLAYIARELLKEKAESVEKHPSQPSRIRPPRNHSLGTGKTLHPIL